MMYSAEAEKAVLGAMLLDSQAISAGSALDPGDLYLDSHRAIYTAIRRLYSTGANVDFMSVRLELERTKQLDSVGGFGYVMSLEEGIPRRYDVTRFVAVIREKATLRRIVSMCEYAAERAALDDSSEDILHDLQGMALQQQAA